VTCDVCGDLGMLIQPWTDAPHDYAICLCPAAAWYRSDVNAGRHTGTFGWQLWCAMHQVDPARVFRLEEIYSPAELAAVGLSQQPIPFDREAAILAAAGKRAKR
jgi:hypothetical protein